MSEDTLDLDDVDKTPVHGIEAQSISITKFQALEVDQSLDRGSVTKVVAHSGRA